MYAQGKREYMSHEHYSYCSEPHHDACRMVHSTDIVEFELRSKKFSLAVRKKEAVVQPEPMYLPVCSLTASAGTNEKQLAMTNIPE